MFKDFICEMIKGDGASLFVRRAGPRNAPSIVLLHGYPQTSAMWHGVAPILARSYQVVCPDLRGYGQSDKPASDSLHQPYSKRAMANDIIAVMRRLGHKRFLVGAHDRGARVAHRMGLDHPNSVVFYMPLLLSIMSFIPCLMNWRSPTLLDASLLIFTGFSAILAHLAITKAFTLSDATYVLIFDYFRLPLTAILAFYLFRETTNSSVWIGGLLIFFSSSYIISREKISEKKETPSQLAKKVQ